MVEHRRRRSPHPGRLSSRHADRDVLRDAVGLAADGKTDRKGLPKPLQLAILATEFSDEVRLARPPVIVQRILFVPLAALGRLAGYRGWYPRYSPNPIDKRST